ncbi:hypothetical protein [Aquitalea sp. USM4]|uniref:hypothetical protein n=1 Tax=Aquitalea sp. USM4 TaxID=1590041 RepID=UPI0013F14553|nr:hypothetical protein [Aquitalea sp. USM4]
MSLYGILVDTPTHDALDHPVQRIVEAANEAKADVTDPDDFLNGVKACGLSEEGCESCQ